MTREQRVNEKTEYWEVVFYAIMQCSEALLMQEFKLCMSCIFYHLSKYASGAHFSMAGKYERERILVWLGKYMSVF